MVIQRTSNDVKKFYSICKIGLFTVQLINCIPPDTIIFHFYEQESFALLPVFYNLQNRNSSKTKKDWDSLEARAEQDTPSNLLGLVQSYTEDFPILIRIHIWILPNIEGINNSSNSAQTFPENLKRNTSHLIPRSQHYSITQTRQRHYKRKAINSYSPGI